MSHFPGTANWKELMMPYRDRSQEERVEELEEENARLERAVERTNNDVYELNEEIEKLKEENERLQSRRRGFFGSAERQRLEEEVARLTEEVENLNNQIGDLQNEITRLTECCKRDGERSLRLMTERDELKIKLREATGLRAHAIAVELVHAHLKDPDWLPNHVAAKAIMDSGLATKILELQREREAVASAQNDLPGIPASDARDLVQLLVGANRHTIILPLRHAMTAIRAAVECWGQEVMEKAQALKGGLS